MGCRHALLAFEDFRDLGKNLFRIEHVALLVHDVFVAHDPLFVDEEVGALGVPI